MIRLALAAAWLAATATPVSPADMSGEYSSKMGRLSILEGDDVVVVSYSASFDTGAPGGPHVCGCAAQGKKTASGRIAIGDPASPSATLELVGPSLVLAPGPAMWAGCCGAGWPGDRFRVASAKRPKSCTVAAPKVELTNPDIDAPPAEGAAPQVAAGDKADVVSMPTESPRDKNGLLLVRVGPPGKRQVGAVKRTALSCPRK